MIKQISGNLLGLSAKDKKNLERITKRRVETDEIIGSVLAREVVDLSAAISRRLAILIDRRGRIIEVAVGDKNIVFLPELKRFNLGTGRLRNLRVVVTDLSKNNNDLKIPDDVYLDLEKLRLDLVCMLRLNQQNNQIAASYAWLKPVDSRYSADSEIAHTETVSNVLLQNVELDFASWIVDLEAEHIRLNKQKVIPESASYLIGIYPDKKTNTDSRMAELKELAQTASCNVIGQYVQFKRPHPQTLIGKGKLDEIILSAMRQDAEILIFDHELTPGQWRAINNATELKVIDRSMLILDIFAAHATSNDGKLQVELAQLKYNLPKLVEKDQGLSRLTGGIGGRGPGETKLEVSRRYYRDRIKFLEGRIDKLSKQRALRRQRRTAVPIPLVALVGYTNVGKSTLFNALTTATVIAENKLFATLDTTQRQIFLQHAGEESVINPGEYYQNQAIISDTVGFIRDLPAELKNAFRATLEELGNAHVLVHVLDGSDGEVARAKAAVEKQLEQFGFADIPRINVLNKTDLISDSEKAQLAEEMNALCVSAVERAGFEQLRAAIKQALD